jgi:hypothetical protein
MGSSYGPRNDAGLERHGRKLCGEARVGGAELRAGRAGHPSIEPSEEGHGGQSIGQLTSRVGRPEHNGAMYARR